MIFGKVLCVHFDILMSQYGQEKKIVLLGMCPNIIMIPINHDHDPNSDHH